MVFPRWYSGAPTASTPLRIDSACKFSKPFAYRENGLTSSLRSSPAFSLVVVVTLALYGLIGVMVLMMQFQPGFMGMAHGTQPHHRIHDITFALLLMPGALGLMAQLRRPSRNIAGQLMALIPWIALLLAFVLAVEPLRFAPAPILGGLTLVAALFHPARRDFLGSVRKSRVSWLMLALAVVASVPLLAWAFTNVGLQGTLATDHAALGHYGFMAAFSFTVVGIALVASLRPIGWKLAATVAGVLPIILGLASLVYAGNDSSLGQIRALAAITWGVVFITVGRLAGKIADDPVVATGGATVPEIATGTPRLVIVVAVVLLALAAVLVIRHVTGGDFPTHAPG